MLEKGYQLTKTAVSACHDVTDLPAAALSGHSTAESTISAHLSLAKYCDQFLRQKEAGTCTAPVHCGMYMTHLCRKRVQSDSHRSCAIYSISDDASVDCPSMTSFPSAVVTSLLRAMRVDSAEARQRFPRLLNIVSLYPTSMDVFLKLVSSPAIFSDSIL